MCLSEVKNKIYDFKSFNSFIGDIERIHKNCLNYNNNSSEIPISAKELERDIKQFKNCQELTSRDSHDVLKEIFTIKNVGII